MKRVLTSAALFTAVLIGPSPAPAQDEIFVANLSDASVTVYARLASGDIAPLRTLRGPNTGLSGVWGVAVDVVHGELFVASAGDTSIAVFDLTAAGDTAPKRKLKGPATLLNHPQGIALDPVHDELVVSNIGNASITAYARGAVGDTAPLRVIQGGNTKLNGPIDVAVDWVHDELVVVNQSNNSVTTYARPATGDAAPLRVITGDQTLLNIPRGIALDLSSEEIVVANNGNSSVVFFPRGASGNVAPLRRLNGLDTGILTPNSAAIDGVNGELVLPNFGASSITAYALPASGNTPPLRTIDGANTAMNGPLGIAVTTSSGCGTTQVGALGVSRSSAVTPLAAGDVALVAAILPNSRSVRVGCPATAFATVINSGTSPATGVSIAPAVPMPVAFAYQTTDPQTNALTGTPNTPVTIPPGQSQSFVIAITPQVAFGPIEVAFTFAGSNTAPVGALVGTNTLLLSGTGPATPDIVALVATVSHDGIANIPGPAGTGFFTAATFNVGAGGSITVSADTGTASPPVTLSVCRTDPVTGVCFANPGGSVTLQIDAGQTPTFAVFATATGDVLFDPAVNRIFLRFKDGGGVTRGSASVAVRTL